VTELLDRPAAAIPPSPPRSRWRRARVPLAILTALAVSTGTAIAGGDVLRNAGDKGRTSLTIPVAEDAYTFAQFPDAKKGTGDKLVASSAPGSEKVVYLKFVVKGLPADARDVRATVRITRDNHHLSAPVAISTVPETDWSETALNHQNAPDLGKRLVEVRTGVATRTVSFDLGRAVPADGVYAFAVTSDSKTAWASFRAKESGQQAPTLLLEYGTGGASPNPTAPPTPSASASASPVPSASASATPKPTQTATPPTIPIPAGATQCGASFLAERAGESRTAQLARVDRYYNGLEMVRLFYTQPPAWAKVLNVSKRTVSISFKYPPKEIIAGKHDAYLKNWFKTAPRDQQIYWTYYHEPEDNIASGEYTAADYRAAWAHLRKLADTANNPKLRATLILMHWSLMPLSKRNWRDYYPGRNVIQVLGWDAYNMRAKKGEYQDPAGIYGQLIAVSRAEKLPFAVAETGSHVIPGDDGTRRAAWIRAMAKYLTEQKALFVAYFDIDWSTGDYRLRDPKGMAAWREFCS
jgi:hypothetical protein